MTPRRRRSPSPRPNCAETVNDPVREPDARRAFGEHLKAKAVAARSKYGPHIDAATVLEMLRDRDVVRYPTTVEFDAAAEVASVHGHFEWFGQEALQRGYKVALMGAGDNHHGRPAYSIWHRAGRMGFKKRNYGSPGAISGVYTHELTRRAVIKAFRQRRVFAAGTPEPVCVKSLSWINGPCRRRGPFDLRGKVYPIGLPLSIEDRQ